MSPHQRPKSVARRATAGLLWLLGAGLGCGHTKAVGDTEATAAKTAAPARETTPPTDHKPPASRRATPPEDRAARKDGSLPVFTTPAAALKPEAVSQIQERLVQRDQLKQTNASGTLDDPTREALREFQRSKGLPATGLPDDATIEALGLKPADVFRAAQAPSSQP